MKKKLFPYFILFCALGLSITAAYYSVMGLSILFASVAIPVIIMGSFLEISKIAIATYLHDQWKKTLIGLKIYLTVALVTLSLITSLGIYGLLTTGFQENISKMEIGDKQITNIEVKKDRFENIKSEYIVEKQNIDKDISQLRNALSNNTTTQYVDKKTGQLITRANTGNRKAFESQLSEAQDSRNILATKIESLNDSITNLDFQILDMESKSSLGNELGSIKYVSEITGKPIKQVANIFILIIIFVFDPLAIILIIAANQAFKNREDEPLVEDTLIEDEKSEEETIEEEILDNTNNEEPILPIIEETTEKDIEPEIIQDIPISITYQGMQPTEEEIEAIKRQIQQIQNSGVSQRKRGNAINELNNKLNQLKKDDDNTISYT